LHTAAPVVLPEQGGTNDPAIAPQSGWCAEENSRHVVETAQKLSHQLRAAEDRIAELEAEVNAYQERAERAEQWLHRVCKEIEDRFLRQDDGRHSMQRAAVLRA